MMWILRLALRNALRNVRRSTLTASTIVIGVALFVVSSAWLEGTFGQVFTDSTAIVGEIRIADPDFIEREALHPLYEYVPNADAVVSAVAAHPGVTSAHAIVRSGVAVTAGEALGDNFAMATGADEAWMRRIGLPEKLVAGRWPAGEGEWLLGARIAKRIDAQVGDEIILFGQTQDGSMSPARGTMVGIVQAGHQMIDMQVFMPLSTMQYVVDIEGGAVEVLAYTDDLFGAAPIADAIAADPALAGLRVQSWDRRAPFDGIIGVTSAVQGLLGGVLIFLTSLAIWNTMTMSVLERTSEIGVLRALGMSRVAAVGLFVLEAAVIALVGGVVGVALGALPALYLETHGLHIGEDLVQNMSSEYALSTTMYADLDARIAVQGLMLGLLMAVVGSLVPSARAATILPVEAMRHGR
jgi:putative ABC transport system permease protein